MGAAAKVLLWPTVPPSSSGGGEGKGEEIGGSSLWRAGQAREAVPPGLVARSAGSEKNGTVLDSAPGGHLDKVAAVVNASLPPLTDIVGGEQRWSIWCVYINLTKRLS